MKQKFRILTFVKVADEMPSHMIHFDKGFIGIVAGTYSQLYGGGDTKSYSLYKVQNDRVVDQISWYNEEQLIELTEQDRIRAEEMIEEYHLKEDEDEDDDSKWESIFVRAALCLNQV